MAGRELRSSKGPAAAARVDALRACAGSLESVLRDRASLPDNVGAQATLMLLELGKLDRADLVARYSEASNGAWRAVAARAATGPRDGRLRRRFIGDGDQRVRKAALFASLETKDAADLDPLLEAARLDPDPLLRSLAVRAVGAIGGQRAVLALKDLWAQSDGTTRETIVDAWAMPALYRAGEPASSGPSQRAAARLRPSPPRSSYPASPARTPRWGRRSWRGPSSRARRRSGVWRSSSRP